MHICGVVRAGDSVSGERGRWANPASVQKGQSRRVLETEVVNGPLVASVLREPFSWNARPSTPGITPQHSDDRRISQLVHHKDVV